MQVSDIMTSSVVTVQPETALHDAVQLMIDHDIGGLPVVDEAGRLAGILTESDLLRRTETATERQRRRWAQFFVSRGKLAEEYVASHGRKVGEVMTAQVVTVAEEAPLGEAVELMERRRLRRLPVLAGGRLVGIVSRTDILHALASLSATASPVPASDAAIRARLRAVAAKQEWVPATVKFIVRHGIVELRGVLFDDRCRAALRVLAENVPGVTEVEDHLVWVEPTTGMAMVEPESFELKKAAGQ